MDTATHNMPIHNDVTDIFNVVRIGHAADNGRNVIGDPKGATNFSPKRPERQWGPLHKWV